MIDAIQPRALLVNRVHHPPSGLGYVGSIEHDLFSLRVLLPSTARFKIHGTELPLLQWIVNAAEKPQVLFLVCD